MSKADGSQLPRVSKAGGTQPPRASKAAAARRAAVSILGKIRRRGAYGREVLRSDAILQRLDAHDVALVTRLVLGVSATYGALDDVIDAHVVRRHLDPRVRDCLRCSTYELLWMNTPAFAVVSQGVELVRSTSPRAAALANAVLRRISELRPQWDESHLQVASTTADITTCARSSGMPVWLVEQLYNSLPSRAFYSFIEAQREPAPVYVAALTTKHSIDESYQLLQTAGLQPHPLPLPGAFELHAPSGLGASGLVEDADIAVCDLAAQAVCRIAAPAPHNVLLEVGQGRATKTLLIHAALHTHHAACSSVSVELHADRVQQAQERVRRAHIQDARTMRFDARCLDQDNLPELLRQSFDTVFVDAPCSGTGTLRRHPEIVWSLTPDALDFDKEHSLPRLQFDMLCASAARVRLGGTLVYATCSVLREENEAVIERFLASQAGASFLRAPIMDAPCVQALGEPARSWMQDAVCMDNERASVRWSPVPHGCDGHFCCRMKKVSA